MNPLFINAHQSSIIAFPSDPGGDRDREKDVYSSLGLLHLVLLVVDAGAAEANTVSRGTRGKGLLLSLTGRLLLVLLVLLLSC